MNWKNRFEPPLNVGEVIITKSSKNMKNPHKYMITETEFKRNEWYVNIATVGSSNSSGEHSETYSLNL